MDSITQAALGAAIGEAVLGKRIGNKAMVVGAVVATLPDLDIIVLPMFDQVQRLSVHRGYSHSIIGVFLLSLLLTWALSKWKPFENVNRYRLFSCLTLVTVTHVLLDAFTTYGTQLFLPFTDYRVAFDSITIVDPVYTLPLIFGVLLSLLYKRSDVTRRWLNAAGLSLSSLYLAFTLANKNQVDKVVLSSLQDQGIQSEKVLTIPVSAANLLWYGVAKTNEGIYLGEYSVFDENKLIEFHFFPTNESLLTEIEGTLLLDRMKWFSNNLYTVSKHQGKLRFYNLKCDMSGFAGDENQAPTNFFFEMYKDKNGEWKLTTGMHPKKEENNLKRKLKRMFGTHPRNQLKHISQ